MRRFKSMDSEYWEIALLQALHNIEVELMENSRRNDKCKVDKNGSFELLSSYDNELLKYDLLESIKSPIMTNQTDTKQRKVGVVEKQPREGTRQRKVGVAERNETEREVVYRTLRNFIKLNRLRSYNMF